MSGETTNIFNDKASDSNCDTSDSCARILSESESSATYEKLLDSNPDIKFNSSEENFNRLDSERNVNALFISGVTAAHDLSDLTVSNFLWTAYCCKDG